MDKLLSVIVPSYNMEKYLPKCLGSLIIDEKIGGENRSTAEGSFLDLLDVIVVNDGSTDRTSEIAHEFEKKYPGVFRVIDKPNGNYGSCINAALPIAAGRFVKILDADDTYDTVAFAEFVEKLAESSELDLVLTDYDTVDASGAVVEEFRVSLVPDKVLTIDDYLRNDQYIPMHAMCFRTEMLRTMRYRQLEGVSYTDAEWSYLPLFVVRRALRLPLVVYKYLLGRENQTMNAARCAADWWMHEEVTLDMVTQAASLEKTVEPSVGAVLKNRLVSMVSNMYRVAIWGYEGHKASIDIQSFDRRLKGVSPSVYEALNHVPYARHIPYRFIRAHRQSAPGRFIMFCLCKQYTSLARFTYGILHR